MGAKRAHTGLVTTLPKWAQQIIGRQQETINGLRKELEMFTRPADPGDAMTYQTWHYSEDRLPKSMALPPGQFKANLGIDRYGRTHEIGAYVETDYCGRKSLRLMGMEGPMHILPVASNTITITTLREEREED